MFFLCTSIVICNHMITNDPALKKCPNKFLPEELGNRRQINAFESCTKGIIVGLLYCIAFIFIFETIYSHYRPANLQN